jgi:protocatechuate 3,4-dioxygenase beta subunit
VSRHENQDQQPDHDAFGGLARDVTTLLDRRRALRLFAGTSLLALAGCGSRSPSTASAGCAVIPDETAGPYPGDGSNGPNVLSDSGVIRSDIRSSFGSSSGEAEGVPLTIVLALQDSGCKARSQAAVYLWHCDRDGNYSLYSPGVTGENYLRGLQPANPDGTVTFRSIFPAAYSGRYPHVHFEIYRSVSEAASDKQPLATSQLALPAQDCEAVYATSGYEQSKQNFAGISLTTDNVFRDDGAAHQLATTTGGVTAGYQARLVVPVNAG